MSNTMQNIISVKRSIDQGMNFFEVKRENKYFPMSATNERAMTNYSNKCRGARLCANGRRVPIIRVLIGPSRSGKTSTVYDEFGFDNVFAMTSLTGQWYDGYDGQKVVLFDNVGSGSVPPMDHIKRITNGYPIQVPIRRGFTWFQPEYIYFISNHPLNTWWTDIKYDEVYKRLQESGLF
jgi:hypothetical protein